MSIATTARIDIEPRGLPPSALYRACDPQVLGFTTTAELESLDVLPGQERALEALRLGLAIRKEGFNVYALGPPGAGKLGQVLAEARARARTEAPPPAWCYVHNFADPRRPRALRLPGGRARPFARAMDQLLDELRSAIPAAFESDSYRARKVQIEAELKERGDKAFAAIQTRAEEHGVAVGPTATGVVIGPIKDGVIMERDVFLALPADEQQRRKQQLEDVGGWLRELQADVPRWARETRDKLRALDRDVTLEALGHLVEALRADLGDLPEVLAHLDLVQSDILENAAEFMPGAREPAALALKELLADMPARKYRVNVLVDPGADTGAPVVHEDSPSYASVFGRLEHRSELGALVTDHMLIASGAVHRANGGYLVVDALQLLGQPFAWVELKRCLRSHSARIEPVGHRLGLASGVTLEPEAIPLDLKVILLGERLLYYLLAEQDPELLELFKIAADYEDTIARTSAAEREYARLVATVAKGRGARPLDREAVACAIEHAARDAGDAQRLSAHVQGLADLVDEADHHAAGPVITAGDVRAVLDARIRRAGRVRDRLRDELRRGTFLVDTGGERAGQVNGLSVMRLGDLSFGHPTRITARVRVGAGEVVDIEREVELGGPLHSKGVLILAGFLGARYARDRPLSLAASLVFEQSYGHVEGDSASLAELCALLSALAEVPIRQALAVTGSVNQLGVVQPIGGVNDKIEGFFDACRVRGGPTPGQGVLIPAANVQHLMLRPDIIGAVASGSFAVHPVASIDEAMALLTSDASVNDRVERRLTEFARSAHARRTFI